MQKYYEESDGDIGGGGDGEEVVFPIIFQSLFIFYNHH